MILGVSFTVCGLLCGWWIFLAEAPETRLALVFPTLCLVGLGLAYMLRRPGWLLKRSDGHMRWQAWLFFWPYLTVNHLSFTNFRKFSNEDYCNEIIEGLFLGRRLIEAEALLAERLELKAVVDLTCEFNEPGFFRSHPGYLCLPTLDTCPLSLEDLKTAVQFIHEQLPQGNVYVHCALGHGRSALVVLAYLLKHGSAKSPEEAFALVAAHRPGIYLGTEQWTCLRRFHQQSLPHAG
jgi:protein-tyrosine phosphatase